jgi:hypothetical protein
MTNELKDVYFRKFLVPIIITLLILCGIVVIVSNVPGTPVKWDPIMNQISGGFRNILSARK